MLLKHLKVGILAEIERTSLYPLIFNQKGSKIIVENYGGSKEALLDPSPISISKSAMNNGSAVFSLTTIGSFFIII